MEETTSQALAVSKDLAGQKLGSYRVIEPLGSGGMSTVYRAVHDETGHEVALKVLLGTIARNSNLLQRFLREARSAEVLEHPNVVAIYDRGVDQGRHYLVLEYVSGGDFHDYVQRHGPLGAAEAVAVVRGVASGLRYAATRGLIHRDIKPSNILRTANGEAKIIDLGLALHSEFEDERVTREGTTVGTVDYMAPEQARDSRATSIKSDMYSLGCTFYYLLTGIPPYPGGDITEKLTRHARSPAPDVRDLRSEIPASVAGIVLRLMAKQPEDRFGDYDELIAALDAAGRGGGDPSPEIPLVPLEADKPNGRSSGAGTVRSDWVGGPDAPPRDPVESDLAPLDLDGGLPLELADERPSIEARAAPKEPVRPLPRIGSLGPPAEAADSMEAEHAEVLAAARPDRSLTPWFLATGAVVVCAAALVIGLHLILGGPRAADIARESIPDPDRDGHQLAAVGPPPPSPAAEVGRSHREEAASARPASPGPRRPARPSEKLWEEPADTDPVPGDRAAITAIPLEFRAQLPEWARTTEVNHAEGHSVVVRRVADLKDGATTEPTLQRALDKYMGGTVELADQGPLVVDDLRMSGSSNLVRARPGFRPIVRIARSGRKTTLDQDAFLVLDRKTLTLEGLDLIVDAADLSGRQRALFSCAGSNLTLRDCTVTVINPNHLPFTLVRQEPAPRQDPAPRPSRIRLERTLVRGSFFSLAELGGGPADLVLDGTSVIVGGVGPPVVRVIQPELAAEKRVFFVGAMLACPGPILRCDEPATGTPAGRVTVRTYGSAFGRLQGPGIASIVTATADRAAAGRVIDWAGDRNVFAGWRGFFASGTEPTITVDSLAKVRSTWSASEQGSQEILLGWTLAGEPEREVPSDLMARFLSGRLAVFTRPPGPGLFPKTVDRYPAPSVPDVSAWALSARAGAVAAGPGPRKVMFYDPRRGGGGGPEPGPGSGVAAAGPLASASPDLILHTGDRPWDGDLGAFLRDRITSPTRHLRVRVLGTGSHRCTPVRLPDGLTLEIQVVPDPPGAEPPSWSPDPQATGPGLIELRGGTLVASGLHLVHDPASRLESLLALDDAHLVLYRCQLAVPPDSGGVVGDLIRFRAATTRRQANHPGNAVFAGPVDRPICRLIDTVLIAGRVAVRAEIGRGLVALTRSAVVGEDGALELAPTKVSRRSFEADLCLDRCTLLSGRSIVRLGPWPGVLPGPDRPWLVNSRHCAVFAVMDTKPRESALLRVDADAFAGGCLFWQADGDAYELDNVIAVGEVPPVPSGPREILELWARFWGANHAGRTVSGPRGPGPRLRDWPRPGRIEPPDLILERVAQPQGQPEIGADLPSIGISPRPPRAGARRN